MTLKIKNKTILDIFFAIFFYFQILIINVRSSTIIWLINFIFLLFIAITISKKLKIEIKKMWIFLIFLFFWIVSDIIIILTDLPSFFPNWLTLGNLYLISFQLPVLALLLKYLLGDVKSILAFALISLLISYSLYYFWYVGFIEEFKYQIIGNISLLTIIIFQNTILSNKKILKFLIQFSLFLIILNVGSRQSLIGLIILLLIILLIRLKNSFKSTFTVISIFSLLVYFITQFNESLNQFFLKLNTISRFIANFSLDSASNNYRIRSANNLIENFSILPNGHSYTLDPYFLEPHNLFLEIIFLKGYLLGGIIISFLLILVLNAMLFNSSRALNLIIIVFLVPAMVSFGLHASRFFIIGILALMIEKSIRTSEKINNLNYNK